MTDRVYAIHGDEECERLEAQARLAPVSAHLRHLPLRPGIAVLDAGCGSGSMARTIAAAEPGAQVTAVDLRESYLDFARRRAHDQGLNNVRFERADVRALPFPDVTFDLVWSKYLLQWVTEPLDAMREFSRVLKPGGALVLCNFDGFGVTHEPPDPALQSLAELVFAGLVDPFIGRKMAGLCAMAGFTAMQVAIEADTIFTVVGAIDPERRRNWAVQWDAARGQTAKHLGSEALADAFIDAFMRYQDRADTASYCALYFVSARKPD